MAAAMGVWTVLLLMLIVGGSVAAPPSPTVTKRSDENIQFGNQQNKPVSVLDEDALPGAFPSSETTENEEPAEKPTSDPEEEEEEAHSANTSKSSEDEDQYQEPPLPLSPEEEEPRHHLQEHPAGFPQQVHHNVHQPPLHREEMIKDLPPVALASRWRAPPQYFLDHAALGMTKRVPRLVPITPMMFAMSNGVDGETIFPARRRRRSTERASKSASDPRKVLQVSLHALRTGHRHKRDVHELRRIRRDLGDNIDLDKLRREVDVVELLAMLARPPPHHNPGYATVTYAPIAPAPPKYAPQPKLYPDYEEEEDEEDERGVGMPMQSGHRQLPPPPPPEPVVYPAAGGRVWRRSGGGAYGLSAMPGFKRSSAFRANTPAPPPPMRQLNPGVVYSLAAMLGAELDPASRRIRRVAM